MSLKVSPKEPLPLFSKLHTVPAMTNVAKGLTVIRKATAQIVKAEDYLLKGVTNAELDRVSLEIAKYAKQIDKEAAKLVTAMSQMSTKVADYEKELKNAIG